MKKSIFLFFAAILCAMTANAAYNQSAVDLYFDNSEAKWSSCYVYIGHGSHTCCYPMTRVSGTQYLWQLAKANFNGGNTWGGATGWVLCKEKWWDKADESIDKYTWHGAKNVTKKRTSAWSASYIYKTNGTVSVTSDGNTINAYNTTTVSNKNYKVTINTVEGGTLTVKDYDDQAVASGDSKIHLTVLKFSATPASGYVLDAVEINDGTNTTTIAAADLATSTHTLTSAITINPVWRATTSTVTVTATATNGTVTGGGVVEAGTSVTLTATPADGYKFVNWTVGGAEVSTANPYTFTAEEDVTVVANFEELPKATIYFVNNGGWSKIQAYAWGDNGTNASWAGVDITANKLAEKIGEYDVYSYTVIQGSYKNVIFNDGSAQTADYVWTDGNYYWYDSAIKKEDKFAGGTKADAESALAAVVNYDYYLTGSLVGGWDPKQKGIEKDGELYKATFADLAAGTYEFKITKGDWAQQWNYSNLDKAYEEVSEGKDGEGNPNGNIKIVTTAVKTITVIFDATANKISFEGLTPYVAPLTYTVTVPAGTEKCFIAGAMNGWNFQEMTPTANANEFTIDIAGARESDGYKYACKADWDYVEKKEDGNDLDANRTWKASDVVAKWGVPPTYTIVGATAITGANWDLANEANKMIKDGEAYTLTKTGLKLETGDYEYKVAKNGAWGDGQYPAEGNQKVTITETAEYTIVYTYNVGTSLTAVATKTGEYTPVQTVYTVAGDAALCGTNWQADDATNDMTANGDGTYTWTKADVKLTSNVGFKVVKNHDFGNGEYPTENWNINLANYEGAAIYTVTITFTESSKDIAVTLTKTGETTPPVITYVLMGVNNDWTTGIALTRNEANTDYEEYMLLNQPIVKTTDAVKVVKLVDGEKKTYCGKTQVKDGSATCTADEKDNIILEDGKYNFYYAVEDNQVYIGKVDAPAVQSGKFSTGKYEYAEFAPGNLQYHTSNGTWHFAQNQYDFVGEANINVGDPNYKGWIDMFGWSTDDENNNYGVNPNNVNDLYDGTFQDWGTKMGEGWSTLSADQWKYLLNTRPKAKDLKQIAKVGDIVGIMLFPDNWNEAPVVEAENDSYFKVKIYNYDLAQWANLEAAGAIFLPAAGRRTGGYGNMINKDQVEETDPANLNGGHYKHQDNTNIYCYYWTSTINDSKDVSYLHNIQALGGDKYTIGTGAVWGEKGRYGQSVRLAKVTSTLIEIGDGDNSAVITANAGNEMDVQVNRTFKANEGYYTICLPFDLAAEKIGKALQISSVTENIAEQGMNVFFTEVTNLVAGQPYLVLPSENLTNPIFENVEIVNTTGETTATVSGAGINITFTGIINGVGEQTNGSTEYYVGDKGWLYNGKVDKLGLRAFFTITDAAGQEVKNIRARVVTREDAATGFENITNGENTTIKVIENGQLIIIRNGEKFNAQGQKL